MSDTGNGQMSAQWASKGEAPHAGTGPAAEESTPWLWLALVTGLAVVLRVIGADSGLWYDEILTLHDSVRAPLRQIVSVIPGEHQHTLFSLLAHLSIGMFGEHPWSLRLPALMFGAATVPLLFFFGRQVVSRTEAWLASLVLAVAYHAVWFSQNARGYSMLACFAVLSSWWLMRGLRDGRIGDFAWYGVAAALGAYTHPTMVFLVGSHALLCLMPPALSGLDPERAARRPLAAIGIAVATVLTLLLYAPVLLAVRHVYLEQPEPMGAASPTWALIELIRGLRVGLGTGAAALVGGGLIAVGAWSYATRHRFVLGLLIVPSAFTVIAAVFLHRPVRPRFLFLVSGFAVLVVVRGALEAGRIVSRWRGMEPDRTPAIGLTFVALIAAGSIVALVPNYRFPKQDFDGPLRLVESQRAEGEPVVTVGATTWVYQEFYHQPWVECDTVADLQRQRVGGRRVWVLHTLDSYIETETPDLMALLRTECTAVQVFPGTLGDGSVTVCTMPALPAEGAR